MSIPEHRAEELAPRTEDRSHDVAQATPKGSWLLVGGLMTQVHASLRGYSSRATEDVDVLVVLVDIMANTSNSSKTLDGISTCGYYRDSD